MQQLPEIRNKMSKSKPFFLICFLLYVLLVIYITLFAWNYGSSFGPTGLGGRNYNFIPFRSIYRIALYSPKIADPIKILLGNIVLFLPFGILLPLLSERLRESLISTVFLGMLFSLFIELNQLLFTLRVSDIDDLILNTLGAFLGALLIKLYFYLKKKIICFKL